MVIFMKRLILPLFSIFMFLLPACGSEQKTSTPAPVPPIVVQPPGGKDPAAEFTSTIKPILAKNCGGGNCHTSGSPRDAVIQTAAAFINGGASARMTSSSMPPVGSAQAGNFSAGEKTTLLAFIAKYK